MNNPTGAKRPAIARKLKWIAVAAIVFILGLGAVAYADYIEQHFAMGPDNIMGVMPPNYGRGGGVPVQPPACGPSADLTLTQSGAKGRTVTYVSSKSGCVYTIKRNGTPWATVTFDASTKTYKLTDPNGTGSLLLELGTAPGLFWPHGSNSTVIKKKN